MNRRFGWDMWSISAASGNSIFSYRGLPAAMYYYNVGGTLFFFNF